MGTLMGNRNSPLMGHHSGLHKEGPKGENRRVTWNFEVRPVGR